MPKIKVLQVSNSFAPCIGGVEKVVYDISTKLDRGKFECEVLCLDRCPYSKEKLSAEGTVDGVIVHRIPFTDLHYYKVGAGEGKFFKNFDIIDVHGIGFLADWALFTKFMHKKKIILHTHGGIFHTGNIALLKKIYFNVFERILLGNADKIVAISKNDYGLFSKISKKVVLIENGIDYGEFSKLRGKKDANSFLFVGRFSRNKQIDLLIKTFSEVCRKNKDVKLYLLGKDWDNIGGELKKIVKEEGMEKNIIFVSGEKETVREMMKNCQYFVSASRYEGFGISTIEAMAAGLVPILNDIESFRNFVQEGKNGFIVDFAKTGETAAKILEIMQNREIAKIAQNAANFASKYDWKSKIKEFEALYEGVLK